jgi:hypothetical protein
VSFFLSSMHACSKALHRLCTRSRFLFYSCLCIYHQLVGFFLREKGKVQEVRGKEGMGKNVKGCAFGGMLYCIHVPCVVFVSHVRDGGLAKEHDGVWPSGKI